MELYNGGLIESDMKWHGHELSNRAIFNDLERPQTQISRSGHCLMLNISEIVKDTVIVTMEGEEETVPNLQTVPFLMTLSDL